MTEVASGPRIKDYKKQDIERLIKEGNDFKKEVIDHFHETRSLADVILPNFHFLSAVYQPPSISKGGIWKPDSVQEFERGTNKAFLILKMGPSAFDDKFEDPEEPLLFKKGVVRLHDWVCVSPQSAGLMVTIEGVACRISYDKKVMAKIPYPAFVW